MISVFTSLKKLSTKKTSSLKEILPEDWLIKRGNELLKIVNGISTSNLEFESDGTLLYLKVSDMNNPKNKPYILETVNKCNLINELQLSNILDRNSVVFPKRGAAIFTNKVGIMGNRGTLDPNMMAVIPKVKDLYFIYLYYYLVYFNLSNICENAGLPQLNKKDLNPLKFIYPPFYEQQKIVTILENVDNIIQSTQRLIEKLMECKKGIMQQLFKEGIGHTEFKDTKLGPIPYEWDYIKIQKIAKVVGGGTPNTKKEEYWSGDILWVTPTEITKLKGKYISNTERKITELGLEKSSARIIPQCSLIVTTRATIGACAINKKPLATNQGFQNIIPKEIVNIDYLYYYFSYSPFQRLMKRYANGSTFLEISNKSLKNLKIPLPTLKEQKRISKILDQIESQIYINLKYRSNLEKIKRGLMQVLLTSKKRVKP